MNDTETKLMNRLLTPDEIDVRVATPCANGTTILFYKDARVDQNILDEVFGPLGWKNRYYSVDGKLHCVIGVWDESKSQWIEKDNRGIESAKESAKGEASDAFKRAGSNLGIGRELYTMKRVFIPSDLLRGFDLEGRSVRIRDTFCVVEINSENSGFKKRIKSIRVGISLNGEMHHTVLFESDEYGNAKLTEVKQLIEDVPAEDIMPEEEKVETAPAAETEAPAADVKPVVAETKPVLTDDDVLLIGGPKLQGRKLKEVRDTAEFKALMERAKTQNGTYNDAAKDAQFAALKAMAL